MGFRRYSSDEERPLRPGSCLTKGQWRAMLAAWNHRCAYCGTDEAKLIPEHVEPPSRGGENVPENIVPACQPCNSAKGHFLLLEWVCLQKWLWVQDGLGRKLANVRLHQWSIETGRGPFRTDGLPRV